MISIIVERHKGNGIIGKLLKMSDLVGAQTEVTPRGKIERGSGARTGALVIAEVKSGIEQLISGGNRHVPVEQVVDTNFDHLDIAIVGGERIAGKERGLGRNHESSVAQAEIVVLEFHRPIVPERIFEASAHQPAAGVVAAVGEGGECTAGERHARREVGDGQVVVAEPAAAGLAVQQPVIDGPAEAGSHCRDPAIVVVDHDGSGRNDNTDVVVVIVACPVEVPFSADDELADLVIAADLSAADESAVVVVVVEIRQEECSVQRLLVQAPPMLAPM